LSLVIEYKLRRTFRHFAFEPSFQSRRRPIPVKPIPGRLPPFCPAREFRRRRPPSSQAASWSAPFARLAAGGRPLVGPLPGPPPRETRGLLRPSKADGLGTDQSWRVYRRPCRGRIRRHTGGGVRHRRTGSRWCCANGLDLRVVVLRWWPGHARGGGVRARPRRIEVDDGRRARARSNAHPERRSRVLNGGERVRKPGGN